MFVNREHFEQGKLLNVSAHVAENSKQIAIRVNNKLHFDKEAITLFINILDANQIRLKLKNTLEHFQNAPIFQQEKEAAASAEAPVKKRKGR